MLPNQVQDRKTGVRHEKWLMFRRVGCVVALITATIVLSAYSKLPKWQTEWDFLIAGIILLLLTNYGFNVSFLDNVFQFGCYIGPLVGVPRFSWISVMGNVPGPEIAQFRKSVGGGVRNWFLRKVNVYELRVRRQGEDTEAIRVVVHRRKDGVEPAKALIVYFHGGGMVIGAAEDPMNAMMSAASQHVVVCSVDFRLAPEHRFPAPFEDCLSALLELTSVQKRAELNLAADARIGVAGFSGGGGLAAAVSLAAHERGIPLAGQFLMVPMIAPPGRFPSYFAFGQCNVNSAASMCWFWQCYTAHPADFQNKFCCPIEAPSDDLKLVAPAFIYTASCDVLRDEGEAYAARLREQGVKVRHIRTRGSHIGCLMSSSLSKFAREFCEHLILTDVSK